jgi:hypothetical protein
MKASVHLIIFPILLFSACVSNEKDTQAIQNAPLENPAATAETEIYHDIDTDVERLSSEAYDYRVLLPLFPKKIAGAERQVVSGENYLYEKTMIATSSASYSDEDRRFSVVIQDAGKNTNAVADMTRWSSASAYDDAASQDQSEELHVSKLIDGQPAYINYDAQQRRGSISWLKNYRFIVDISARNVAFEDLEKALLDLKLSRLK